MASQWRAKAQGRANTASSTRGSTDRTQRSYRKIERASSAYLYSGGTRPRSFSRSYSGFGLPNGLLDDLPNAVPSYRYLAWKCANFL